MKSCIKIEITAMDANEVKVDKANSHPYTRIGRFLVSMEPCEIRNSVNLTALLCNIPSPPFFQIIA